MGARCFPNLGNLPHWGQARAYTVPREEGLQVSLDQGAVGWEVLGPCWRLGY